MPVLRNPAYPAANPWNWTWPRNPAYWASAWAGVVTPVSWKYRCPLFAWPVQPVIASSPVGSAAIPPNVSEWLPVPSAIVLSAVRASGLDYAARMIAAEALARS